jgi:dTDP-4-amino-4,6-dideoxygalactose transaminase
MTTKKPIPYFPYPQVFAEHEKEYLALVENVLRRGAFILQKDLQEFETNLARYLGIKHAFGVANCTDGLLIALRLAGVKPGDEVIFPSHTFVATAAAIHFAGGIPLPVDCGADHLIDPEAVESAVTSKTRFLMPVQLNGRTCRMDALQKIADKHGLKIVEDAAQALGSRYKGRPAGTFGVAAAFSFYPAKSLNCFGDGGAVVTDDDAVAEGISLMRDHGRNADGDVVLWGLNSRLDNLHAAILNFKLARYEEAIRRRREIATIYDRNLRDIPSLRLPPAPDADPDHFDVFQNYEIEADRRDELRAALKEWGIGTMAPWGGKAVHQFQKLGMRGRLPRTEELFTRCLLLPMNTHLSNGDAETIAARIREFYGK